jgi:hypothetical protein
VSEAHLIPRDDLVAHSRTDDCVCGPVPVLLDPDDDPLWDPWGLEEGDRWVYRHYPLDGRAVPWS